MPTSPKSSTSLPLASRDNSSNVVLPTPSSSTTVRTNANTNTNTGPSTKLVELEHQLAEKEKQLQECSGGIEKNVLTRQIGQIKDKIQQLNDTKRQHQLRASSSILPSNITASSSFYTSPQQQPSLSTSTGSVNSTGTANSSSDQDQLAPETLEKLRFLERDLNTYRTSLVPGVSRKEKLLNQRSNGLNPLPSPSSSSMQESSSSSLLPLPPPPAGSTPTKRRSKVPNNDRRNTDIEFATEIGQGLLLEVRKMQTLLQEKEEQLRTLQIQKADLERAAEALTKLLRQKDEAEEQLKEETWNLELAKQELTMTVTELQQNLNKANTEQNKLHKQLETVTSELEQVKAREDKLTSAIETLKTRHEQDMASVRRHMATMQREKAEQTKQMELLSSELAIAKAQTRIAKKSHQDLSEMNNNGKLHPNANGSANDSNLSNNGDAYDETSNANGNSNKSVTLSPSTSSKTNNARQQAMEVETLKTSLSHAHRMISTLRSNLHNEKKERMDLRKLLLESQETIEQLQNDPRMWEDATPTGHSLTPSHSSSAHPDHSTSTGSRRPRRTRRRSRARVSTGLGSNRNHLLKDIQNTTATDNSQRSIHKRRKTLVTFDDDDDENNLSSDVSSYISEDDEDEDDEDSEDDDDDDDDSDEDDSDEYEDEDEDMELNNKEKQRPLPGGFTSLSMELSRSQQSHSSNNSPPKSSILSSLSGLGNNNKDTLPSSAGPTSLSMELSKHFSKQPEPSQSTSSEHAKVNRSIGDELSLADAFSKAKNNNGSADNDTNNNADLQELLKAVGFTDAGNSFMDQITQALDRRGVDSNTQTDDVVVLLPGTMKDTPMQTDEVIVSLPKESVDMNLQTDDVVVTLPKEYVDMNLQTDDVVVTLPKEYVDMNLQTDDVVVTLPKEYIDINLQTDDVVVTLPKEYVDMDLQTDDVIVSLPKESVDVELQTDLSEVKEMDVQTDEVVVSLPKESADMALQTESSDVKEMDVQTDDVVVSLPKEINHMDMQTDDVVVSYPVESMEMEIQTDSYDVKEMEIQTDPYDVKEMDVQTDDVVVSLPKESNHMDIQTEDVVVSLPVQSLEMEIQTDPLPVPVSVDREIQGHIVSPVEGFTQTTPAIGIDQMAQVVQHDLVKTCDVTTQYDMGSFLIDQGTQSEQASLSDKGVQSILPTSNEIGIQTTTLEDDNEKNHTLLAIGHRDVDKDLSAPSTDATTDQDDNNNNTGGKLAALLATGAAATLGAFVGNNSSDKNAPEVTERSVVNNNDNNNKNSNNNETIDISNSGDNDNASSSAERGIVNNVKEKEENDNEDGEQLTNTESLKDDEQTLHNQKEVDAMIAAAVAKALEEQKKQYENQLPTPTSPVDKNSFISGSRDGVTLEDNNDNDNDKRHTCDMSANNNSNNNGVTVSRDNSESKRSINTDRTITTKSSTISDMPSRPMTPPPASLLAKSGALHHYADSYHKGKSPMQTNGSILSTSTSAGQYGLSSYHDHQQRDSSLNTISQPTLASSIEPTISLITDTMMGHWLWKDPRHKRLLKSSSPTAPSHQRFFWMHPYTRTLYWSNHAPGSSNKDMKTKSAYIEDMTVVTNNNQVDLPKVSINVSTSEGDMRLTAPDMDTHKTWVESLSYVLSRQPEVNGSIRMVKPNHHSISSRRSRTSLLHDLFNNSTTNHKRHTLNDWTPNHHHHHHHHDHDDDDDDERLEDLRDCCNGKHHLSSLERDFIKKRPRYPKKSYRHTMMT